MEALLYSAFVHCGSKTLTYLLFSIHYEVKLINCSEFNMNKWNICEFYTSRHYTSGCNRWPAGQNWARQQYIVARVRSRIILIAAGSEIDWSRQQQLLTIRVWAGWFWMEQLADFLKVGASWFFTRTKSAPPPLHHEYNSCQRVKNITAYLAGFTC